MKTKLALLFVIAFFSQSLLGQEKINQFDSEGKRHGVWKKYYPNSKQLRYQGTFNHGKEEGEFFFYCENCKEQPIAIKKFSGKDSIAFVQFFRENGKRLSQGTMKGKKRIGKWEFFHKDGTTLLSEEEYVNGVLDGIKTTYYANKVVTKTSQYKNGIQEGKEKYFSPEGILLKEFTYKNGELHGVATYYDADGNLIIKGNYKNGRKHGTWKYFKNGKLIKEEIFPKPLDRLKKD